MLGADHVIADREAQRQGLPLQRAAEGAPGEHEEKRGAGSEWEKCDSRRYRGLLARAPQGQDRHDHVCP